MRAGKPAKEHEMKIQNVNGKEYCINSAGSMVPIEAVRDIDKLRDSVVTRIAEKIKALEVYMKEVKAQCMSDIEEFLVISAEQYNVKMGGSKGNVMLTSYDGSEQIVLAQANNLVVNEGVNMAKTLIDEYLADITSEASPDLRAIVTLAFRVKQGRMDVKRLMELKQCDIRDERWLKAMEIISDSVTVASTTPCLRLRDKTAEGVFKTHMLEFSTI
ncbi:MAG: DUF3164 family protein [Spirochaetales bacterium]|nr:DUF3164 family protein [Spirochaetales bacterium]